MNAMREAARREAALVYGSTYHEDRPYRRPEIEGDGELQQLARRVGLALSVGAAFPTETQQIRQERRNERRRERRRGRELDLARVIELRERYSSRTAS